MSVVISKMDRTTNHDREKNCIFCQKTLDYPYLEWDDLLICAECCRSVRKGLMADMIHAAAIAELHSVGYRWETFERKQVKQVEEDERKLMAAEDAALHDVIGFRKPMN